MAVTEQQQVDLCDDRVVVAMSGGVDSSVVAAMMVEEGHETVGISMRLYKTDPNTASKGCCSPDDLYDARSVARRLDMPFYVVNYQEAFKTAVIDRFVDDYRRGLTPSPCVLCNNHLKFDTLLGQSLKLGAKFLATGHYAIVDQDESGRYRLRRGRDQVKDQSYFLFGLRREDLPRLRFPLGDMTKAEVRELAQKQGLPTAMKAESQDLCFVGGHYLDFLEKRLSREDRRPGDIVHVDSGETLGSHAGIHRYTVGQRRGLGIGGGEPLYVTKLDAELGIVYVGGKAALGTTECTLSKCNWLAFDDLDAPLEAGVQIRYRHRPVPARIEPIEPGRARIVFASPERAVSPGQAAVVYDGDEVVGGGWIDERN